MEVLKQFAKWFVIVLILVLLAFTFLIPKNTRAQTVTFAAQELANTFQMLQTFLAGIQLNGASSGSVTLVAPSATTTYNLVLPGNSGSAGQVVCVAGSPGQLGWCTPAAAGGGFVPKGDLGGSASSQKVLGISGVPIAAAPTINGQVLKFNASTNQYVPGTCP